MSLLTHLESLHGEVRANNIPEEVLARARDRLLDALSTTAGSHHHCVAPYGAAARAAGAWQPGCDCWMIGSPAGHAAERAAFVNGVAVHSILYEDINFAAADHPGAPVVPAALAAAEEASATIGELIAAIVLGYETHLALGAAAADGVRARGLRTTSVFGTVGAAAAGAYAHALPAESHSTALRLAANYSFGTIEGFSEGSDEPFLQAGVAAALGLLATRLAASGAFASRGTFDGPNGFLRAFADVIGDVEVQQAWRIMDVSCKAYPISAGKLSSMDSAVAFAQRAIAPARIAAVLAEVPESAVSFPGSSRVGEFTNYTQAQDSTAFCIAAAICGRDVTELATFLDGYGDADIAEFTRRITLSGVTGRQLTKLTVTLADGEVVEVEVDWRANRIPSVAAMSDKLRRLGAPVWGADGCERLIELVVGDPATRVSELGQALRGGR